MFALDLVAINAAFNWGLGLALGFGLVAGAVAYVWCLIDAVKAYFVYRFHARAVDEFRRRRGPDDPACEPVKPTG